MDAVIAALEAAAKGSAPVAEDWSKASLERLSGHIVATHYAYVKRELPRLALLAQKVVARHGTTRVELPVIQSKLTKLDEIETTPWQRKNSFCFHILPNWSEPLTMGARNQTTALVRLPIRLP